MVWYLNKKKIMLRQLYYERRIIWILAKITGGVVIKYQTIKDDGGTDGIIKVGNIEHSIEARCKGYPNYHGKICKFKKGWDTDCLVNYGVYLNESTIKNYKGKSFIYAVEIQGPEGSEIRIAVLGPSRIDELLLQPKRYQKSVNTGNLQSVKSVPVSYFEHKIDKKIIENLDETKFSKDFFNEFIDDFKLIYPTS